ncbi:MAG: hypothetical protein WDO14_24415 [Bacteroidota bacterium]
MKLTLVFVHGYSVTNLNTYGELPLRLKNEAGNNGFEIDVKDIFLGRYISFNDAVRLEDVSRAFNTAFNNELKTMIDAGEKFICITHSTGGPVARDWWNRYYKNVPCPMSHLIMLAPANYGSALAQLGKSRLSRIKSWFDHVEPGQLILDWLELGSAEAWSLNVEWIRGGVDFGPERVFPFVIVGECIDRKFYDVLNSYTGELGSDGVIRSSAANLKGRYIKLEQPVPVINAQNNLEATPFTATTVLAPDTPFRIVASKSHSGDDMGIVKSVKAPAGNDKSSETIKAIFDCCKVTDMQQYAALNAQFIQETEQVQIQELIENERTLFGKRRSFIHDKYSMVIFRVRDTAGYPVIDYDLILTAGDDNPHHLPEGFLEDKQRNRVNPEIITYYFNYNVMHGMGAVTQNIDGKLEQLRGPLDGITRMGLRVEPRPSSGFVHYLPCEYHADAEMLSIAVMANTTTLVDIILQRNVHKEVAELVPLPGGDFKTITPGTELVK